MQRDREGIDQVRRATEILDVVREFSQVKLKKRGQNWVGLCPFHSERTPSFNVDPDRGYFKCFGCDKSGDIFEFVMSVTGMTFGEALRALAKRANVRLPDRSDAKSQETRKKREPLHRALGFAAEYFQTQLQSSDKARDFLTAREFSSDTISQFKLGYAPDGWRGLLDAAGEKNIDPEVLIASGLAKQHKRGHQYDLFRDRIMFPIWSTNNQVVGFGGRRLTADKSTPKYINSPETDVYHKSVVLYGLNKSRPAIREFGEAIVVEGYTDVLALHQAGVKNVVAGCGTALTGTQVKILNRYTKSILLIFDADQAGVAAAHRALDLVLSQGLAPYVVSLPNGADPDSFVRDHGAEKFRQIIASRKVDFVRFLYNMAHINGKLRTPEGRSQSISNVLEKIGLIEDSILADQYLEQTGNLFRVGVDRLRRWRTRRPVQTQHSETGRKRTPELKLLEIMLQYGPPVIAFVQDELKVELFSDGTSRMLAENLIELFKRDGDDLPVPIPGSLLRSDPDLQKLAADLSFAEYRIEGFWAKQDIEVPSRNEHPLTIAGDIVRAIKLQSIDWQVQAAKKKYESLEPDDPERRKCVENIMALIDVRGKFIKEA